MQAHNQSKEDISKAEKVGRKELVDTIVSLRQDLYSMASDIKEVLKENAKLKTELHQAQERPPVNQSISEMQRMKQEIDDLMQLHQLASFNSKRSRRPSTRPVARSRYGYDSSEQDRGAWIKKMMMFMMMAELI